MAAVENHLSDKVCERARQARDQRFDGRFFICVKTTGIYCRPVCPAPMPMSKNIQFHMSAAAAEAAGFRPCLRCRPETAPATPAWNGTTTTVHRALRLIEHGFLDDHDLESLGDKLGIGARHLSRLFSEQIGASPKTVAETRRLHLAKRLLDETRLPMTDVALASGYGSIRRFNDAFRRTWQRTPTELRKAGARTTRQADEIKLTLRYRPPFDWLGLLDFLGQRAIPGIENTEGGIYRRSFSVNGTPGTLSAEHLPEKHVIAVTLRGAQPADLPLIIGRVRRLFDLDADPMSIAKDLARDRDMKKLVRQNPGQRLPGAFDAYEIGVRAIIGQQVSVKSARAVADRLAAAHGADLPDSLIADGICRLFPTPKDFLALSEDAFGLPKARARTILGLSEAMESGQIKFDGSKESSVLQNELMALRGIGPWTASYMAIRVLDDPDAFPEADLALLKVAEDLWGYTKPKELLEHAEAWRPWRAYAALHLWRQYPKILNKRAAR